MVRAWGIRSVIACWTAEYKTQLTFVKVVKVLVLVVARVPSMAFAVLAGLNDEDNVSLAGFFVIV